ARRRHVHRPHCPESVREHGRLGRTAGERKPGICQLPQTPAALSHVLPRSAFGDEGVQGSRPGYGRRELGCADGGIRTERDESRAAVLGTRRCPAAQGRGGIRHEGAVRRSAAHRPTGAGCRGPRHRRLSRRPEHGCNEPLSVWRSGGRARRPGDAGVASVVPGTFPDAGGDQERMRKLKIIEHISLDGVIQHSADGDDFPYSDWTAPHRSPAGRDALLAVQGERFDLLLGRRTYDIWSGFWPKAPSSPMADGLNTATKHVVTHRPKTLEWGPFKGIGPDIVQGVRRIKSEDGPDLILWGSSTLT